MKPRVINIELLQLKIQNQILVFCGIWILRYYWKFYFAECICYCTLKVRLHKTSYFCFEKRSFERDVSNFAKNFRICCFKLVLCFKQKAFPSSAFCRSCALKRKLVYARLSVSDLTAHHSCVFNFSEISMLKTIKYLSSFKKNVKIIYFDKSL